MVCGCLCVPPPHNSSSLTYPQGCSSGNVKEIVVERFLVERS
ncbi:hypothetical protein [Candidatus Liberibacter solanacearum]|nr:hypothetical protein [Candidatus Liberibacter solanacearum]